MVHDLWMLQVVEEVGLTRASDLEPAHFRFLALIEGDVPDESAGEGMDPPAAWADLQPNEYPTCRRVERATYTVLLDVEGERWSKIVEADNWVDAERQVLSYFADSGYHPGTEILIGATLFGAHGCWEPEDYRFTTYNGLPWKAC